MTRKEAKGHLLDIQNRLNMTFRTVQEQEEYTALEMAIKALEQEQNIKALGEDMRMLREGIIDEKVLIGFNMAVALCNKYLAEGSDKEWNELQTIKTQEPCSEVIAKMNNLQDFFDVQSKAITNFISRSIECGCQQGAELVPHYKDIKHTESKGHWIADVDKWGDVVTTINGYKCSECGEFNADKDNYCPNCGARMESEE